MSDSTIYRVYDDASGVVAEFFEKHYAESFAATHDFHIFAWDGDMLTGIGDTIFIRQSDGSFKSAGISWQWLPQREQIDMGFVERRERESMEGIWDVR